MYDGQPSLLKTGIEKIEQRRVGGDGVRVMVEIVIKSPIVDQHAGMGGDHAFAAGETVLRPKEHAQMTAIVDAAQAAKTIKISRNIRSARWD